MSKYGQANSLQNPSSQEAGRYVYKKNSRSTGTNWENITLLT